MSENNEKGSGWTEIISVMRKALEFYANPDTYKSFICEKGAESSGSIFEDVSLSAEKTDPIMVPGRLARETLAWVDSEPDISADKPIITEIYRESLRSDPNPGTYANDRLGLRAKVREGDDWREIETDLVREIENCLGKRLVLKTMEDREHFFAEWQQRLANERIDIDKRKTEFHKWLQDHHALVAAYNETTGKRIDVDGDIPF